METSETAVLLIPRHSFNRKSSTFNLTVAETAMLRAETPLRRAGMVNRSSRPQKAVELIFLKGKEGSHLR